MDPRLGALFGSILLLGFFGPAGICRQSSKAEEVAVKPMGKLKGVGLILVGVLAGVLLSLNLSAIAQRDMVARGPLPYEDLRTFTEVFGRIKADYVEPVEDKKLISEAITGMLTGLDPHSAYLDQDAFKELQVGTQGEFGGLGIEVGMEDGFVKVVSPIEDTPAFRAGLKPGDLIIKIDDSPTKGITLNDAVKKMRGPPKTSVKLTVLRKGESRSFDVTLMRDKIRVQSVKSKTIEPGYGYVRVSQFQEHTVENLVKHVNGLYKEGALKGLVLDLRNDPGGLLNGAIGVSAAFLPSNALVVSTDGRTPDAKRKFFASPEDYVRGRQDDVLRGLPAQIKTVPLVVLVNTGSASASEIVAGALQDHKRATVMGVQTFGKGSVQTILPLSNSTAIKLTTARYYTPNGRSIQAKGIVPDIEVEEPGAPRDRVREVDLQRHLLNDREKEKAEEAAKSDAKSDSQSKTDADKEQKPIELGSPDDFQLKQAMNHLKGLPVLAKLEQQAKAADAQPSTTAASATPADKASPKKN
jgi:carboxyl-terminal processing protease